jgi:hypothetical protein
MSYTYPLSGFASFVERVDAPPPGARARRWVLRDDNQQHYHGVVHLDEDPLYVELHWRANARAQEQLVGVFRLHLARLLADGYVRREHEEQPDDTEVRLRFYRGSRSVICVQVRDDQPALPIGIVDATLG